MSEKSGKQRQYLKAWGKFGMNHKTSVQLNAIQYNTNTNYGLRVKSIPHLTAFTETEHDELHKGSFLCSCRATGLDCIILYRCKLLLLLFGNRGTTKGRKEDWECFFWCVSVRARFHLLPHVWKCVPSPDDVFKCVRMCAWVCMAEKTESRWLPILTKLGN